MRRLLTFLTALFLFIVLPAAPLAAGDQESSAASDEETIGRILELRSVLEELLASLPEELREEVEKRWRERSEAETPKEEATVAEEPPPPAPSPAPPPATRSVPPVPQPAREPVREPIRQPVRPERQGCGSFELFDNDGDGFVSASDRYWRYFYLRIGRGGGSEKDESLFDLGIRKISVDLKSYTTDQDARGGIVRGESLRLELIGKARKAGPTGDLAIDADGLARSGLLGLVDSSGAGLTGIQTLSPALRIENADGESLSFVCP